MLNVRRPLLQRLLPRARAAVSMLRGTCVALALAGAVSAQDEGSTPEVFEKVDPYTRGKSDLVDRAGYVSMGPFQIAESLDTPEVEEVLGGLHVLWVETAHFRLGSLLQSYRRGTDDLEEKKLAGELARLAKSLPRVRKDVRELDPWLRMHLFAQRLEEQYADFQDRAGVKDADFAPQPAAAPGEHRDMGPGLYLGNERKFVVLLTERTSQLQRFARRWIGPEESSWYRARLPGGAWFFGAPAEVTQQMGTTLDSALHALVATGLTNELCDGLRGSQRIQPLWLKHGLGLAYGRAAEPRWCVHVPRESTQPDDKTWQWEPRLNALVANDFIAPWHEMLEWKDGRKLEARDHMTAWSRVAWLEETDPKAFAALLLAMSAPTAVPSGDPTSKPAGPDATTVLQAAYGKTPEQLDEAWRKWVRRKYPRK